MPKLPPVNWKELVRRLRLLGFDGPFSGGKHPYMVKGERVLTIPNAHRDEIGPALLARILRQAGIDRDQWLAVN